MERDDQGEAEDKLPVHALSIPSSQGLLVGHHDMVQACLPEQKGNVLSPGNLKTGVSEKPDHFPGFPLFFVARVIVGLFYHAQGHARQEEIPVIGYDNNEPPAGPEDAKYLPYRIMGSFQMFEGRRS